MPQTIARRNTTSALPRTTPDWYFHAIIAAGALAVIWLAWTIVFAVTRQERADAIELVKKSNANIARVVEEHTVRALAGADHVLRMIRREYEQKGAGLDLPGFYESLNLESGLHINSTITNAAGEVVLTSTRMRASANLADREHFKSHAATTGDSLIVGKPVMERITQRQSISLTRRISGSDGTFAGIVAVNINPFHFTDLYREIDLGQNGIIALAGMDGIMRARIDTGKGNLGQDVSKSEVYRHIRERPMGSYAAVSAVDGRPRIFSYRAVREYPLLVNVGMLEAVALAPVHARLRSYVLGASVLSALIVLGAGLSMSAVRRSRRHAAELAGGERRLGESRALFLEQQTALTELARDESLLHGEAQPVFERITRTAAHIMKLARVSIWRFSPDRRTLVCCDLYEHKEHSHATGAVLAVADFPAYFAALGKREVIDAVRAHDDPRTYEFADSYLTPLGITSMLDVPVFLAGELDGVMCIEHVGEPIQWMPEQILFATALAQLAEIAVTHAERRRVQAELARSEAVHSRLFYDNPMPMWVRDKDTLSFLAVNNAAITAYGYMREEFLAMKALDIRPADDLPRHEQMMRDELAEPERTHVRLTRHRKKDGSCIDVQVISHPFVYGRRVARLVLAQDVTDVKRAESALRESQQRLRALLDGIPDRVWLKDIQGRFVAVNRSFEEACGMLAAHIIGKTSIEVGRRADVDVDVDAEDRRIIATGEALRMERHSLHDDSWRAVVKAPIRAAEGAVTGVVCISRDITERKRMEQQKRDRDREQRRAFVREIHHRIKNHIQGVAGLLQGYARRQPALAADFQSAVAQLQAVAVIHGLQGAAGRSVRLDEMAGAICESIRAYADGGIEINFSPNAGSLFIDSDEAVPVALIVNELLMNAVKYCAPDGSRWVNTEITSTDNVTRLRVCNRGRLTNRDGPADEGQHGLSIIRALLPQGAAFDIEQQRDTVYATLTLHAPVVTNGEDGAGEFAQPDTEGALA